MTENNWWSTALKRRLHLPERGWVAKKVQDITNRGMPDVLACFNGSAAVIELKYRPAKPKSDDLKLFFSIDKSTKRKCIVSVEQGRQLLEWDRAAGNAFVLIGVGGEWSLLLWETVAEQNYTGLSLRDMDKHSVLQGEDKDAGNIGRYIENLDDHP